MYLSRLFLDPRRATARRDLSNPYEMHRTLLRGVTEAETAGSERLLWRVEPGRSETPTLLVQTHHIPRWDAVLDHQPGYARVDDTSPKEYRLELRPGSRLRFRLKANACVKREGKRHALRTPDEKLLWMEKRATANGLHVEGATMVSTERLVARKRGLRITLDATLFEGVVSVEDATRAHAAVARGIGHAKGFGLGLLSVAALGGS